MEEPIGLHIKRIALENDWRTPPPSRCHGPVMYFIKHVIFAIDITINSVFNDWTCGYLLHLVVYWLQTNRRTGFLRSEYIIVKPACKTWILYTLKLLYLGNFWQSSEKQLFGHSGRARNLEVVFPISAGKARKLRLFTLRSVQIVMLLPIRRGHKS